MNENILRLVSDDLLSVKKIILNILNSDIKDFEEAILSYLKSSSKMIRPILCLLFQKALYNKSKDEIIYIAAAIEIAHNSSLLHDDVIDEAKIRRGTKSFNEKFNAKSAILAGDWLIAQVMSLLNKTNCSKLYEMFALAIRKMAEGELFQLFNKGIVPTMEEYFKKNFNKTGQLFKISVLAPMILNNDYSNVEKVEKFAFHFSNAFQIADDIDDYFVLNKDKPSNLDKKSEIYTLPDIIRTDNPDANLYEECCKILNHQVNLSIESLDFMNESAYKDAVISLCHSLLRDKKIEF